MRLVVFLCVLFLCVYFLLKIPVIQNWATQRISSYLSNTLGTTVSIDHVGLRFFDKLAMDEFLIRDMDQDTLLYSQNLAADFKVNPIALIRNRLSLEEVSLTNGELIVKKSTGEFKSSLQEILNNLIDQDTSGQNIRKKKPFFLDVDVLHLNNIIYKTKDETLGKELTLSLRKGEILFKKIDLPGKRVEVKSLNFQSPLILVNQFETEETGIKEVGETIQKNKDETDSTAFVLTIDNILFSDGRFSIHNYQKSPEKLTPANVLDFQHMDVCDIHIDIHEFTFSEFNFSGQVENISFLDTSGFQLTHLSVQEAKVTPSLTELHGLKMETPYSSIGDTLVFKYREYADFKEFPDKVRMNIRFQDAEVALSDIMAFVPALETNTFFNNNRDETIRLNGRCIGRINSLRGRNITVNSGRGFNLRGDFSTINLAVKDEQYLSLRLKKMQTSMTTLRQLIPGFLPPSNFDKLGRLNFSGNFDGFFVDFVADGNLKTDLGTAEMDMRMNLKDGREKASYSGNLSLFDFDMGTWASNPDFGNITFRSEVKNGVGLTGNTANATLEANIANFTYKEYLYENASLNGQLNKSLFDGLFNIKDDNIDFSFRGALDFTDSIPAFDFNAEVNRLDLKQLNLSKEDLVLSGDVNLNLVNRELSNVEGEAIIRNFGIVKNNEEVYKIDSVEISSHFDKDSSRTFQIRSEILEANILGEFDIEKLPQAILYYTENNFPEYATRFEISADTTMARLGKFNFDIQIFDSKNLTYLYNPALDTLRDVRLKGYIDNYENSIDIDLEVPSLRYDKFAMDDIIFKFNADGDEGELDFAVSSTTINKKNTLAPVSILGFINRDTVDFGIIYSSKELSFLENLNLDGKLFLIDSSSFQVSFSPSKLVILQDNWDIESDNYIRFGKGFINTQSFQLKNGERTIRLKSLREKGLELELSNFDFHFIDEVWDYEPLDFAGRFDVEASIGNIFDMTDIHAVAYSDTLIVSGDDWGVFRLDAQLPDLESSLHAYMSITKDTAQLLAEGFYNLPSYKPKSKIKVSSIEHRPKFYKADVQIIGYPMSIFDYFIGNAVSMTIGTFDADFTLQGLPKQPTISGLAKIRKASTTIDYLQTRYTVENEVVKLTNTLFDASGTVLRDKYGNSAVISGGIRHDNLKNMRLDVRLETDRFLVIDTKKEDNDLFYGKAVGRGYIRFTGPFKQANIYIRATVGDSTRIVLPISYDRNATEVSFIEFVEKNKKQDIKDNYSPMLELEGLGLEMDLSISERAEMWLVFDEQAGDIIKGRGKGDIRMVVERTGGFSMSGDYEIAEGEYLFTLLNLINKPFTIKPGGRIQWTGDPYDAKIDLVAEYKDLSTSVANFIQLYLDKASADVQSEARKATDVELTMQLQGQLLKPIINFDIAFPNLTSELKNYTDSKLQYLRQDQNELNRQVFGLIVIGQFIPSDITFQGYEITINTVSELIANQLSILLTELVSEYILDGGLISGIDFDIAYNYYQNPGTNYEDISRGSELQLKLKNSLFNDKLSINIGGNIDLGLGNPNTPETPGSFVAGDLVIEYSLNKDRNLKLRVYQSYEPDIGGGRRYKAGAGISFRKEFESFDELWKSLKKKKK